MKISSCMCIIIYCIMYEENKLLRVDASNIKVINHNQLINNKENMNGESNNIYLNDFINRKARNTLVNGDNETNKMSKRELNNLQSSNLLHKNRIYNSLLSKRVSLPYDFKNILFENIYPNNNIDINHYEEMITDKSLLQEKNFYYPNLKQPTILNYNINNNQDENFYGHNRIYRSDNLENETNNGNEDTSYQQSDIKVGDNQENTLLNSKHPEDKPSKNHDISTAQTIQSKLLNKDLGNMHSNFVDKNFEQDKTLSVFSIPLNSHDKYIDQDTPLLNNINVPINSQEKSINLLNLPTSFQDKKINGKDNAHSSQVKKFSNVNLAPLKFSDKTNDLDNRLNGINLQTNFQDKMLNSDNNSQYLETKALMNQEDSYSENSADKFLSQEVISQKLHAQNSPERISKQDCNNFSGNPENQSSIIQISQDLQKDIQNSFSGISNISSDNSLANFPINFRDPNSRLNSDQLKYPSYLYSDLFTTRSSKSPVKNSLNIPPSNVSITSNLVKDNLNLSDVPTLDKSYMPIQNISSDLSQKYRNLESNITSTQNNLINKNIRTNLIEKPSEQNVTTNDVTSGLSSKIKNNSENILNKNNVKFYNTNIYNPDESFNNIKNIPQLNNMTNLNSLKIHKNVNSLMNYKSKSNEKNLLESGINKELNVQVDDRSTVTDFNHGNISQYDHIGNNMVQNLRNENDKILDSISKDHVPSPEEILNSTNFNTSIFSVNDYKKMSSQQLSKTIQNSNQYYKYGMSGLSGFVMQGGGLPNAKVNVKDPNIIKNLRKIDISLLSFPPAFNYGLSIVNKPKVKLTSLYKLKKRNVPRIMVQLTDNIENNNLTDDILSDKVINKMKFQNINFPNISLVEGSEFANSSAEFLPTVILQPMQFDNNLFKHIRDQISNITANNKTDSNLVKNLTDSDKISTVFEIPKLIRLDDSEGGGTKHSVILKKKPKKEMDRISPNNELHRVELKHDWNLIPFENTFKYNGITNLTRLTTENSSLINGNNFEKNYSRHTGNISCLDPLENVQDVTSFLLPKLTAQNNAKFKDIILNLNGNKLSELFQLPDNITGKLLIPESLITLPLNSSRKDELNNLILNSLLTNKKNEDTNQYCSKLDQDKQLNKLYNEKLLPMDKSDDSEVKSSKNSYKLYDNTPTNNVSKLSNDSPVNNQIARIKLIRLVCENNGPEAYTNISPALTRDKIFPYYKTSKFPTLSTKKKAVYSSTTHQPITIMPANLTKLSNSQNLTPIINNSNTIAMDLVRKIITLLQKNIDSQQAKH